MKNKKANVGSFATAKLQAKRRSLLAIAVIGLMTVMGCSDDPGGDDDANDEHWLIRYQSTYVVEDGIVKQNMVFDDEGKTVYIDAVSSSAFYTWIAYNRNGTDYEEKYTFSSSSNSGSSESYSEHHNTRNGQTSLSTTETISRNANQGVHTLSSTTSTTTATYDPESGLTSSSTMISSAGTTTTYYTIDLLIDLDGAKTYKHTPLGNNWYNIIKIQDGRTLETSYYNESGLISTTTYTQPDNAEIRSKLPNFTLSSARYFPSSYSIRNSYQTAEVLPLENLSYLERLGIRVKTFYDGVLSSQTDYTYEKRNPNVNLNPVGIESNGGEFGYEVELKRWGDFWYSENGIIHIWTGTESNVVIPEQINGKPVTGIAWGAFERRYKLVSVTIPNSVTSIGGSAFGSCWSLASVTIGNSVTSIGQNAFSRCISLTSVTIPNSVTSIGQMAFWDCPLTSVTFQGTIPPDGIGNTAFDNYGLEGKYLEGGVGTYTWDDDTRTWMKQD
ncbi:MAG: leucine-rich repeat domain-containing protein [Treponema sp.]|nr:leucine-rich repeat domain-containing protein [Treponema sp.]